MVVSSIVPWTKIFNVFIDSTFLEVSAKNKLLFMRSKLLIYKQRREKLFTELVIKFIQHSIIWEFLVLIFKELLSAIEAYLNVNQRDQGNEKIWCEIIGKICAIAAIRILMFDLLSLFRKLLTFQTRENERIHAIGIAEKSNSVSIAEKLGKRPPTLLFCFQYLHNIFMVSKNTVSSITDCVVPVDSMFQDFIFNSIFTMSILWGTSCKTVVEVVNPRL